LTHTNKRSGPRLSTLHRIFLGFIAPLCALPLAAAQAQTAWPSKPIKIVVPAPPGSSLDLVARQLSEKLKTKWAQPIVVENKPGAGGMLGTDVAAKADPDGHTMALSFGGPIATAQFLYKKPLYDAQKDLIPVVRTTVQPNVLAVSTSIPAQNLREFITWARDNPGKLNFSSLGMGSSAHLTMELFLKTIGVEGTHIPFNGSPPAALAVAQGEAQATFMVAPALISHVQSGKVRLLAVSTQHRIKDELLGEVPALGEGGVGGVESEAWNGLFVRVGTPADVVSKINADVNAALADIGLKGALAKQGMVAAGGTSAEFVKYIDDDRKRWGAVINRLGLKLD
jgi:tripartite-type tricarboxylate transporter receptor subunit TctC